MDEGYANLMVHLMNKASERGDRYILCPDCTHLEASGKELNAVCSNAATRNDSASEPWGDDTKFVCCSVNQITRNKTEAEVEPQIRIRVDVRDVMLHKLNASAADWPTPMTAKHADDG